MRHLWVFLLGYAVVALVSGGCSSASPDVDPPSEIFITDPQPRHIMEVTFELPHGSGAREVPVSQMLVMFEQGVAQSAAERTIQDMARDLSSIGLALVGQIPLLGIYQIEIENEHPDAVSAIAALDAAIEEVQGYPGVETVSYNELLDAYFAENEDDNTEVTGADRGAFATVDYYQAIPVFDEVLRTLVLNPVKVGIVDSGILLDTGQFDEIQSSAGRFEYLDVGYPDLGPTDIHPQLHGTAVAGIIAADNGDGVTNGIALRVLGDRLSVFVANAHVVGNLFHMARAIAGAQAAVERGARLVNFSLGFSDGGSITSTLSRIQGQFTRLFEADTSTDVLFIAAASNDRLEINGNAAPAGLWAPNLITVGGVSSSVFNTLYADTARGLGIDLAAPATRVPVCCLGNAAVGYSRYYLNGNSFGAPIVTSIAAIVLSIDPSMSGAQLKSFLTDEDNVYPAPSDVSGIRPALLKTVGNAILQRSSASTSAASIMDVILGIHDNLADPSGHMINRMVGRVDFTVSGPNYTRHHVLQSTDLVFLADGANFGILGPDYIEVNLRSGSENVSVGVDANFQIGRTYNMLGEAGFLLFAGGASGEFVGTAIAGSIRFTECELTTRSLPLNHFDTGEGIDRFAFIEIAGVLQGGVAQGGIGEEPATYNVSGSFTQGFMLWDVGDATRAYLEEACEGGYLYGSAEPE